ncbi:MAG: hypothetical protein JO061_05355 [Acidobacteriaceae bacterium]|nr:hypothetical protein [Acidobacteriaceae bacterium]
MRKHLGAFYLNGAGRKSLGKGVFCGAPVVLLLTLSSTVHAESFVPPFSGNLYVQCIGGSAGATSQVGIGSSAYNFVPYLTGLPAACPDTEVLVGPVTAGQPVEFGMSTAWLGQTYWAFSFNSDQASNVAFTDVCNSLGLNGNIILQTSPNTWVMHLNDAAHYTISQCEADNIIVQIRLVGTCSLHSLSGPYTYVFEGAKSARHENESQNTFSAVGRFLADGNGNLSGTETVNNGGAITIDKQYTGTYSVSNDCTGSSNIPGLGDMYFVITNDGQNVDFIRTDSGTNIVGKAQQQFH